MLSLINHGTKEHNLIMGTITAKTKYMICVHILSLEPDLFKYICKNVPH